MVVVFFFLLPVFAAALSVIIGISFGPPYSIKWWLLRLAVVPLLGTIYLLYVGFFPHEVPVGHGRYAHQGMDKSNITPFIWGIILPLIYLIFSFFACLFFVLWKRRN
jgi:hypothetical protein